jgi:hypothetical protein
MKAHKEGVAAAYAGLDAYANPYSVFVGTTPLQFQAWFAGCCYGMKLIKEARNGTVET